MPSTKLLVFGGAALAVALMGAARSATILPTQPPELPTVPDPLTLIPPPPPPPDQQGPVAQVPNPTNSYRVMCEQGGLAFQLGGGLLYLDPETLLISSISTPGFDLWSPLPQAPGPVTADIPDRYQAANCSNDGGRTWGRVLLDFYVPNLGESSGVHTGFESLVLADDPSPERRTVDDEQADSIAEVMAAIQDLFADPTGSIEDSVTAPSLPPVPSPLYSIEVKYKGPLGQYYTVTAPGVVGIPSRVAVVNGNGNVPETLMVSIDPSQTVAADGSLASSGYSLTVLRQPVEVPPVSTDSIGTVGLSCRPLEADVKVRVNIARPEDPGYPTSFSSSVELGYATIGLANGGRAPSRFTLKYEGSAADTGPTRNDFFVDASQIASCYNAGAINIVGNARSQGNPQVTTDDLDLALTLRMPQMTNWTLSRKTEPDGRLIVKSTSGFSLGGLAVSGRNKGKDLRASLSPVPEALTVCSHKGNQCNQPWRLDRASAISFYITSRDAGGRAVPVAARYSEADANEHVDLALSLSDIAYDAYIGEFKWFDPLPGGSSSRYPKWFYFDTMGQPIGGYYHSGGGGHQLNIEIPGGNTRAWNREVVLDKKFRGLVLDFWGYMTCSPGFSIEMDVGGKIAGAILGQGLCNGFSP